MYIGVDGEIKPCPDFPYSLCRLEEDINRAWRTLQDKIAELNKLCSFCGHFPVCGGGCLTNKTEAGKECYCFADG